MSAEEQQQQPTKILQVPPRYDRFFAAARKYNPLVLNEVRRALQDNIKELMKVEAKCGIYYAAENVRIFLLLSASAVSVFLFYEGNRTKFPENVPMMWNCIYLFFLFTGIAMFYVLGYLEARNFLTLVLPSSEKKKNGEDEMLIKFIQLSSSSEENAKADEDSIRAKYVDENGNEIVETKTTTSPKKTQEEGKRKKIVLKKVVKTKKAKNADEDQEEEEEVEEEIEVEEEEAEEEEQNDEEEQEDDETDLDTLVFPKSTKLETTVVDKLALEAVFNKNTTNKSSNNNDKKKTATSQQDSSTILLSIPENVGLQFYSEVELGEPVIILHVELVVFRGALLRPKTLKSCKATLAIEEFFSKEGVLYPPALRVEMRKIVKALLTSNSKMD
jgi:hypothetical protein